MYMFKLSTINKYLSSALWFACVRGVLNEFTKLCLYFMYAKWISCVLFPPFVY